MGIASKKKKKKIRDDETVSSEATGTNDGNSTARSTNSNSTWETR